MISGDIDIAIRQRLVFQSISKKGSFYNLYQGKIAWNYMPPKWLFPPLITLEEINVGTLREPQMLGIARDLLEEFHNKHAKVSTEFRGMFAWLYEDIKGLDQQFYQNKVPLKDDVVLVKQ